MTDSIEIRRSDERDLPDIMEIYNSAKIFMRQMGNMNQWTDGYPDQETVLRDIRCGNHYIAENSEGELMMVFSFILGEDPTYALIEDGEWLNDKPYGTIHRIASSGLQGGMLKRCVRFCSGMIDNIRVDTHADNVPMQMALHRLDFRNCGVIYLADGSPRLAFHKDFRPTISLEIRF